MSRSDAAASADRFLGEAELGYAAIRTRFAPGEALRLDDSYRLAHLPLLAPGHADARLSAPGTDYRVGRYDTPRRSLVIPVPWAALERHELLAALRRCNAGAKIAWDLLERRRHLTHVTIASGPDAELPARLAEVSPFRLRFRGPLVGIVNRGRLYLPGYPERTAAGDPVAALQARFGAARTGRYLMGFLNLLDHLDAAETAALGAVLRRYEDTILATVTVDRLWLLETNDDLALSGRILAEIALDGRPVATRPSQAVARDGSRNSSGDGAKPLITKADCRNAVL